MNTHLKIRLLGNPVIVLDGEPVVGFRSLKAQALFYYLVVTRRSHTRTTLAGLFWGDVAEQHARRSLTSVLSNLRQLLGGYLHTTRESVSLVDQESIELDIALIQHAAEADRIDHLEEAASLYQGDFLEGFSVPDAPEFEQWILVERTRLREMFIQVLAMLATLQAERGNLRGAIESTRRLLTVEPWREEAHRQLMLWLAQNGQRAAALAQYELCQQLLSTELEVEPDDETNALIEQIRSGEIQRSATPQLKDVGADEKTVVLPVEAGVVQAQGMATIRHNLAAQSTPFIGRRLELADLQSRLLDPQCRLITLVGPGGIGKTRLALAMAQQLVAAVERVELDEVEPGKRNVMPQSRRTAEQKLVRRSASHFSDGIFFVRLEPISSPSGIVSAIAGVLDFQFYSGEPLQQQLHHFLANKALLLILDNFEHLLDGAALLTELLAAAPQLKLLVTSQEALKLQEEWFHPLAGLRLPPIPIGSPPQPGELLESFEEFDAVQLFIQSARRAVVNFDPVQEQQQIIRICRLVDGMPLGVELAASLLKIFTCKQIAEEIERSTDILVARHRNIPERHRNMRVVIERSLSLLDRETQRVLQRLALFQGGFDQDAAYTVTGANLLMLAELVDKAWIYQPRSGRYQMHGLLRQFIGAQSTTDYGSMDEVWQLYSEYYLRFIQSNKKALIGKEQRQVLERLTVEIENIYLAWRWLLQQRDWPALRQIMEGIFWFYLMRRRSVEGAELFTRTIVELNEVVSTQPTPDPSLVLFKAILLRRRGIFHYFLGDHATAEHCLGESLSLGRQLEDQSAIVYALNVLGVINGWQGHIELAIAQLRECLELATELKDPQTAADAYHELAQILAHSGDYTEAKSLTEQGLLLCRQLERPDWTAHALDTLGWTTFCLGDYTASLTYYGESLEIFQELGHQLGISLALGGLGLIAWADEGDRLMDAKQYTEEALSICRTIGNRLHMANHLADLAKIVDDFGEHQLAVSHAQEGLQIAEAVGSPLFVAYNLASMGAALRNLNQLDQSRERLLQALQSGADAHLLPVQTMVLYEYAALLHAEGKTAASDRTVRQQKYEQAFMLLHLVTHHPAGIHIYQHRTTTVLTTLTAQMSLERISALELHTREQTLEAAVTQLLEQQ